MAGESLIKDYGQLIDALADRRRAMGMSQMDVDARAGFCDRYMSKVEAWRGKNGRGLGLLTLPLLLETLGVALVLVPLTDKPKKPLEKLKEAHSRLRRRIPPGKKLKDMRKSVNKIKRRA